MDLSELKAEMAEGGTLEPLTITEEGEETAENVTASSPAAAAQKWSREFALGKPEEHSGADENKEDVAHETRSEEHRRNAEEDQAEEVFVDEEDGKAEPTGSAKDGQNRGEDVGPTHEVMGTHEGSEEPAGSRAESDAPGDSQTDANLSEQQPEGAQSQQKEAKKAHRLTPDFPEALYELLCTLQEGRRLNDQRCSFRLEDGIRRRRCHSEPNTTKPANRVIFSSMTSLQREEFFELVATAQARRLDDQRAQLERSGQAKSKARSFRGSIKQLSFVRKSEKPVPAPLPVPKEDLYNMILTTQAQGRLEDQRSRAPGPMDDEDFFSLLLRVQGGRMDEQRTELPCLLKT